MPPTNLVRTSDDDDAWTVEPPLPGSPLVVFVNSKSGDGHGDRFHRRFKQILNPAQVFDLGDEDGEGGPTFGLQVYRGLAPLRLLICGGDGSVGWVLREIDKLQLKVRHRGCYVNEGCHPLLMLRSSGPLHALDS